jgi:hypothetical protein
MKLLLQRRDGRLAPVDPMLAVPDDVDERHRTVQQRGGHWVHFTVQIDVQKRASGARPCASHDEDARSRPRLIAATTTHSANSRRTIHSSVCQ